MHDIEYNEGGDGFYNVPFLGAKQAESVVNVGQSEIIGEAGSKLYNTIKDKEAALESLNYLLGHTSAGQLTPGQVSSTSSLSAPGLEALSQERLEAQKAKEDLARLIQESLDDLPDLYRTSGGQ